VSSLQLLLTLSLSSSPLSVPRYDIYNLYTNTCILAYFISTLFVFLNQRYDNDRLL
jgi:hypothetical protein